MTPLLVQLIAAAVVLLLLQIMVQALAVTREKGSAWNAGPRDGNDNAPKGAFAGRAARALTNYKETLPAFLALALALQMLNPSAHAGEMGALVWIVARVIYYPLYLAGIPYVRSLAWIVSIIGLLMMLAALF